MLLLLLEPRVGQNQRWQRAIQRMRTITIVLILILQLDLSILSCDKNIYFLPFFHFFSKPCITTEMLCFISSSFAHFAARANGGTTWHICWPGWTGRRAVMTSWCLFHALLSADVGGPPRKLWAIQDRELFFSAERDDAESVGAKKIKHETGRLRGGNRRFFSSLFQMLFISFLFFRP